MTRKTAVKWYRLAAEQGMAPAQFNLGFKVQSKDKVFHRTGGKLLHAFMALGKSDLVVLCEFPDDTSAAALSLVVGAAGSVTNAATTKLITMSEFSESLRIAGKVADSYVPPQG